MDTRTKELRWLAILSALCCGLALSADAILFDLVFAGLALFAMAVSLPVKNDDAVN
jgi:hypothetical protein